MVKVYFWQCLATSIFTIPLLVRLKRLVLQSLQYQCQILNILASGIEWWFLFVKYFLMTKTTKQKQSKKLYHQKVQEFFEQHNQTIDYALFIRADVFDDSTIKTITQSCKMNVNYQWDGVDRFPEILDKMQYFDKCYVFDQQDIIKYPNHGFILSNNFYFEKSDGQNNQTAYFIGAHIADRIPTILEFLKVANRIDLPTDFYITHADKKRGLY
ncbi:hypothetical protein [Moraxella caviae]|uniref:hypothetical protein n=1 Tax=Moraxella caviae TaxID=34060 RepID=UPI0011803177|nr:hypothetical protein [Moraxella caviae]